MLSMKILRAILGLDRVSEAILVHTERTVTFRGLGTA